MPFQHICTSASSCLSESVASKPMGAGDHQNQGHLTDPAHLELGCKHEQIGAYLPLRFFHRQPRPVVVAVVILAQPGNISRKGTEETGDCTAWVGLRKCRGGSWRCVIVSVPVMGKPQAKHPTTKASLLPGEVVVLFQPVANAGHSSPAANDGPRSYGHCKREPPLVR